MPRKRVAGQDVHDELLGIVSQLGPSSARVEGVLVGNPKEWKVFFLRLLFSYEAIKPRFCDLLKDKNCRIFSWTLLASEAKKLLSNLLEFRRKYERSQKILGDEARIDLGPYRCPAFGNFSNLLPELVGYQRTKMYPEWYGTLGPFYVCTYYFQDPANADQARRIGLEHYDPPFRGLAEAIHYYLGIRRENASPGEMYVIMPVQYARIDGYEVEDDRVSITVSLGAKTGVITGSTVRGVPGRGRIGPPRLSIICDLNNGKTIRMRRVTKGETHEIKVDSPPKALTAMLHRGKLKVDVLEWTAERRSLAVRVPELGGEAYPLAPQILDRARATQPRAGGYQYNVAISFAGEQRDEAREIAAGLKNSGLEVFFDEYEEAKMWGKDLYEHLSDVYQNRAEYCIILISQAYSEKIWPTHERRSAQARALKEKQEYILPVRFDDTELPGLPDTVKYLNFAHYGPSGICNAFLRKIGREAEDTGLAAGDVCKDSPLALVMDSEGGAIAFIPVVKASWGSKDILLLLEPDEPTDGAFLDGLRNRESKIICAYRYNTAVCELLDCVHVAEAEHKRWELKLAVEMADFCPTFEMAFSGISAEKLAEMRARRLLLNEAPATETMDLNEMTKEIFVRGLETMITVTQSPFPALFQQFEGNNKRFLQIAWIVAVMQLKLGAVVAEIEKLDVSLQGSTLQVVFSGRRKKKFRNEPPYEIRVEGSCPLVNN